MCLANVYKQKKSPDSLIGEYISKIAVDSMNITLTDITNNTTSIKGKLAEIDLENNTIIIEPEE